jgi:glycosyltransferase involved in cell wall biosynthesis
MAKLLIEAGHEAEVFVASVQGSGTTVFDTVPLHRVDWRRNSRYLDLLRRIIAKAPRSRTAAFAFGLACQARELAAALERRHGVAPFQLVQSADFRAAGLFVRARRGRIHVVRCSSAAELYNAFDGTQSKKESWRARLELRSMRRADLAYAPSQYIARYFASTERLNVHIIRPPAFLECQPSPRPVVALPERFFFHFGQLMERKGTALLARALPLAWQQVPELTMVWTGRCVDEGRLAAWRSVWGERRGQVLITGPMPKPDLYAVLQRAEVAVLPSQVDNLPNTVIESLMLGIPVLGSRGASIDELVEEGRTGHLVALGDAQELADALVRMWQRRSPVRKGFAWNSAIAREMQPERAIASLLALADTSNGTRSSALGWKPVRA